jgi:hypothetical protein
LDKLGSDCSQAANLSVFVAPYTSSGVRQATRTMRCSADGYARSGYRMEIYGREGTLVATGENLPQFGRVLLYGAKLDNQLTPRPVPERFVVAAAGTRSGGTSNVGQMYALFAQAILDGKSHQPAFETAVDLQGFSLS